MRVVEDQLGRKYDDHAEKVVGYFLDMYFYGSNARFTHRYDGDSAEDEETQKNGIDIFFTDLHGVPHYVDEKAHFYNRNLSHEALELFIKSPNTNGKYIEGWFLRPTKNDCYCFAHFNDAETVIDSIEDIREVEVNFVNKNVLHEYVLDTLFPAWRQYDDMDKAHDEWENILFDMYQEALRCPSGTNKEANRGKIKLRYCDHLEEDSIILLIPRDDIRRMAFLNETVKANKQSQEYKDNISKLGITI